MILFQTAFNGYQTGAQCDQFWNGAYSDFYDSGVNVTGGPNGRPALVISGPGSASHILAIGTETRIKQGCRFFLNTLVSTRILGFYGDDGGGNSIDIAYVGVDALGRITARNRNGTVLATSAPGAWTINTHNHIWVDLTITAFNGGADTIDFSIVIRLNGSQVISTTGQSTGYLGIGTINKVGAIYDGGTQSELRISDYFVQDNNAPNNDFPGELVGIKLSPDGVGNSSQFTPSAGSNWQNVDDATPNSDTDHNESSTNGHIDTYAYPVVGLPAGAVIIAVQHNMFVRKVDSGSRSLAGVCRSNAVNYVGLDNHPADGVGVPLGLTYTYLKQVLNTDPNTAAAWIEAGVNAAEFGVKITA